MVDKVFVSCRRRQILGYANKNALLRPNSVRFLVAFAILKKCVMGDVRAGLLPRQE